MAAMNQDSATGDGAGEVTRRIKDYCDQAMANLKAGRLKETYLYANEALKLEGKDAKAAALRRHALYALHPKKRLLDKAKSLHEEADRCVKAGDHDKAFELLSVAMKWHCTPGVLYTRAHVNYPRNRFDLAYLDMTEGLAQCKKDKVHLATGQRALLSRLGYKVLPVLESDPDTGPNEMPARYHVNNWPDGLRIDILGVYLSDDYAEVTESDGTMLKPRIPLNQLARFLNRHVKGAIQSLVFMGKDRQQDMVPRLLDEVTAPGRLHVDSVSFADFFLFPWAGIERILNGRILRANTIDFYRLQLPSGVDANKLLQLPAVRKCTRLRFSHYNRFVPLPPNPPPLFDNAALLEWIKRSDGRWLQLTRDYLSSGLLSFLDAIKKDFQQATQVHCYEVAIRCPHFDIVAGLGVRNQELSNRLGEKMMICVDEDEEATDIMGHRFETVFVGRFPPS